MGLLAPGCGEGEGGAPLTAEPGAAEWRPWLLSSGSEIKLPPPPQEDSVLAQADTRELRAGVRSMKPRERELAVAVARAPAVQPWLEDVLRFVAAPSAAGEVLAHFFPKDAKLWRARAREAGLSRIWGGIHWPVDNVFGDRMGRRIGRLVVERAKHDGAQE